MRHAEKLRRRCTQGSRGNAAGVIGITAYGPLCETKPGVRPTLDDMVDHIAYVADLAGVDHVGIGSDFFESESAVRFHAFFRVRYPEVFGDYRLEQRVLRRIQPSGPFSAADRGASRARLLARGRRRRSSAATSCVSSSASGSPDRQQSRRRRCRPRTHSSHHFIRTPPCSNPTDVTTTRRSPNARTTPGPAASASPSTSQ